MNVSGFDSQVVTGRLGLAPAYNAFNPAYGCGIGVSRFLVVQI